MSAATLATAGNLNNDIGMPLMLLRIDASHRYAVIEMGANHAGEIAYLTSLAMPDVVVITNAGAAHLEGFGSLDGVAEGKGEILQDAKRPQCRSPERRRRLLRLLASLVDDITVLSFGLGDHADVLRARSQAAERRRHFACICLTQALPSSCRLPAFTMFAMPARRLRSLRAGRIEPQTSRQRLNHRAGQRSSAADRWYARRDSLRRQLQREPGFVIAAGEFLAALDGSSWLVLGDMGELGEDAQRMHRKLARHSRGGHRSRVRSRRAVARHTVTDSAMARVVCQHGRTAD